jgi:hypothetical protein
MRKINISDRISLRYAKQFPGNGDRKYRGQSLRKAKAGHPPVTKLIMPEKLQRAWVARDRTKSLSEERSWY